LIGIPVAAVGVAIAVARSGSGAKTNDKFSADLQSAQAAGLDLAQSQGAKRYALTEIAPDSKPQPSKTIKPNNGPKAIRSKTPSVKASPEPVAAQTVEEIPQTTVTENAAPVPSDIPVPAVPRPVPQTSESDGPILAGGTARGRSGDGGGIGLGGIFGAIIRGGTVDGDNCDPRPSSGGRQPNRTQPIFGQNPNSPSGMGSGRVGYPQPGSSTPVVRKPRGGPR
jgi:hypothetical protein